MYCPEQAGISEMTEQIDWQEKQPSQVACVSETEVLRSLRHYVWAQSPGHHTKIAWRKEAWKKEALSDRERAIVNQTNIGTVSRATQGKLLRRNGAHTGFGEHINITLN